MALLGLAATLLQTLAASVRGPFAGAAALLCLVSPISPANAAAPVVPLVSAHHHWDHHWFVWMPRHPVYESAEIMSIDAAGNPYRAVWVFFTERHGGKRQVHFFDDRQIVEGFDGSHYRAIDYKRTGTSGRGQSVRVALNGLDDVPIEIAVDLADRPLTRTGAGLTDQSGHSADTLFLLFHRDRNALARSNEVWIGGRDYSFRIGDDPTGKHRFMASYSAGIQIAVIPFGHWSFSWHDAGTHRLAISLDAAVPLAVDAPRTASRFAVHMDPERPVARGEVVSEPMEGGRRLTWRLHSPQWAADYPFESLIKPNGDGYTLIIRSLPR